MYLCASVYAHKSMSTSFTLMYVLQAHTANSGLAAGTDLSYLEGHDVKFRLVRWQA